MPTNRKRVQVSLPEVLADWVGEQSQKTGLPWSSIILTAVARYREQTEAMSFMSKLSKKQIDKALEGK